jgi:glutamyl/glutaminyl-tRNA synthetase
LLLQKIDKWEKEFLERQIEHFINIKKIKFVKLGKPLRFVMINSENGPSITDILFILGKKDSILRIKNYIKHI